jgi:hypothetical protein
MDTDHLIAHGTGPFLFFISYKPSYAVLLYIHKIVNHAHVILGSIALIQVIKPIARKPVTIGAEPEAALHHLLTRLDPAIDACFRLAAVIAPATRTCIFVSYISTA